MTYRLFVKQEATEDVEDAFDWYESRQPGLGLYFERELEQVLVRITKHPRQFPFADGFHRAVMSRFPFKIYFTIEENEIFIVSVYHDKRESLDQR